MRPQSPYGSALLIAILAGSQFFSPRASSADPAISRSAFDDEAPVRPLGQDAFSHMDKACAEIVNGLASRVGGTNKVELVVWNVVYLKDPGAPMGSQMSVTLLQLLESKLSAFARFQVRTIDNVPELKSSKVVLDQLLGEIPALSSGEGTRSPTPPKQLLVRGSYNVELENKRVLLAVELVDPETHVLFGKEFRTFKADFHVDYLFPANADANAKLQIETRKRAGGIAKNFGLKLEILPFHSAYTEEDTVRFRLESDRPCYLYVFDLQQDGTVVPLHPAHGSEPGRLEENGVLLIGDRPTFKVSPPFGTDTVTAVACTDKEQLQASFAALMSHSRVKLEVADGQKLFFEGLGAARGLSTTNDSAWSYAILPFSTVPRPKQPAEPSLP